MPSPKVRPRGDRNYERRTDQSRLRRRGRHARLYRAHQHPRQHPHARLRHPPRIRYRRRRRLQPRADRPRRAPAEELGLLQDRQDHQRAGLRARPRHGQCRGRGAVHRRVLGRRRLFDRRTASSPKSPSANAICSAAGKYVKASVRTASAPGLRDSRYAEPYLLGYRMSGGVDLFAKQNRRHDICLLRYGQAIGDTCASASR